MTTHARRARFAGVTAVLVAAGALTATVVSGAGRDSAAAEAALDQFVPIERITPNVREPRPRPGAATGVFTVDCGTNGNGKFSPDNPVAQPGVRNGAEHLHDFVGNLDIDADSSDAELAASGTTCRNGDRSSYFWPVVRIDRSIRDGDVTPRVDAGTVPTMSCPSVRDRLPAVPAAVRGRIERQLDALDRLQADADRRVAAGRGRIDARLNETVVAPLRRERAARIDAIGDTLAAAGRRPAGLTSLVDCEVSYDAMHAGHHGTAGSGRDDGQGDQQQGDQQQGDQQQGDQQQGDQQQGDQQQGGEQQGGEQQGGEGGGQELPEPQGEDLELPGNTGGIVRPAEVRIEYRGNAAGPVVAMPRFLRALTGDAKPTSRGPANARASWTCSGFADRRATTYPICPEGSRVMRVHDFPGCWDGRNTDSENHRDHLAFADRRTGACPDGFRAIPQLRISISYDIPRDVQQRGQYALDSFPEENHNPFSDHDDFVNVNSDRQMRAIVDCVNDGRRCS